ncbi:Bifunctional polymyxin resistance protein ArnA [Fundidesulfovibrio magnetotacticus]|uniref:Bifunctional polymyxin resistance protein ArnA n=1 Tax=Fundidesulfovibrio magnetotacticus TaxID=2730080 RepID=A0A6V8M331_9BACT|nr:hypothetical protein [Fundidesulfovibrio magnetotacticus]GFK94855.1 Bifunctional polymyxin resistance protein ArnA [Fundidesulfovibrio magnetotacticus]
MTLRLDLLSRVVLFGGGRLMAELAGHCWGKAGLDVIVFTAERFLDEAVDKDGTNLTEFLERSGVTCLISEDINGESAFAAAMDHPGAVGLGFGEPWRIAPTLLESFSPRLLDFMSIDMPQYRGGAHQSWKILRGVRRCGCAVQPITDQTHQGVSDAGVVYKQTTYQLPPDALTPADYYRFQHSHEFAFLVEFLTELAAGCAFSLTKLQDEYSLFFPRLNTKLHGYVDWRWSAEQIEAFIRAFDDPYPGASTFSGTQRVFLKGCQVVREDGAFHPFQAGLVYRVDHRGAFVCANDAGLLVASATDEAGLRVELVPGARLYTPAVRLEEAMSARVDYTHAGLVLTSDV